MSTTVFSSTTRVLEAAIGVKASPMKILGKVNCYKGGEEREGFAEG